MGSFSVDAPCPVMTGPPQAHGSFGTPPRGRTCGDRLAEGAHACTVTLGWSDSLISQKSPQQALDGAVHDGVAPAIGLGASRGDGEASFWYSGHHRPDQDGQLCGPDSIFDLASLTKPLTMGLHLLRLASKEMIDLRAPIGEYLTLSQSGSAGCPCGDCSSTKADWRGIESISTHSKVTA